MTHKQVVLKSAALNSNRIEVVEDGDKVGFRFKNKSTWHWFTTFDKFFYFDHSYSQNTGESKAGLWHAIKIRNSISKIIKYEL